jgi:hypothetical protein
MVKFPDFVFFEQQCQFITNAVSLPFCASALIVYLHSAFFKEFRSAKFCLILLIMNYITITQITYIRQYVPDSFSYRKWLFYIMQEYSYLVSPLKSWLFSAQYFESASLIVEFKRKDLVRKCTQSLFVSVTVLLVCLFLAFCGVRARSDIPSAEWASQE